DDGGYREQRVVGLVRDQIAGRGGEVEADQHGERAAHEEEERHAREIEQRDALVVAREQPRRDAVAVVQVVARWKDDGSHGYRGCTCGSSCSDFTYSISSSSCSSVTRPWNVGMIGWNPEAIFAAGWRIDSRTYPSSTVSVSPFWSVTVLPNRPSSTGPRPCASGRWQVLHARSRKSFAPAEASDPSAAPPLSHVWYSLGSMTTTSPVMPECFVPQYSAQNRR